MIKEIFSNLNIIKGATLKSSATRKVSDINAIAGGTMELNIINRFNKLSKTHRLYNLKAVEILLGQGFVFNFGTLPSLKQLKLECKKTVSQFSASDFLLFEKNNGVYKLVDSVSLKTSIDASFSSPVFLHNDAEGEIYDLYSNSLIVTDNIGQIVMIVKRGQAIKVYHFDGSLSKLFGSTCKVKSNKHNDITLGLNNGKEVKNNSVLFLTNRNAKTGNKPTSFRRGIKIKTTAKAPFLALEDLVKVGAISKLLEFNITKKEVDNEVTKLLGD